MSRIGKQPIEIPDKVQVAITGQSIVAKGPKGELKRTFPEGVSFVEKDKQIMVTLGESRKGTRDGKGPALWGMTRTLISNMVQGVSGGFSKKLEFNGIGYKAAVKGNTLQLNLGYSHPIHYQYPKGIEVKVQKTLLNSLGATRNW